MANMVVGHGLHAFGDGLPSCHHNHLSGHDVAHLRVHAAFSFERYLAGVIAFRKHAHQLLSFKHHQSANVFFGHQFQSLADSGVNRNSMNTAVVLRQKLCNRFHRFFLTVQKTQV